MDGRRPGGGNGIRRRPEGIRPVAPGGCADAQTELTEELEVTMPAPSDGGGALAALTTLPADPSRCAPEAPRAIVRPVRAS